jgi:hypothetical protein
VQIKDLDNPFGNWANPQTLDVPRKKGVVVRVFINDLGWLASQKGPQFGSITYTLDGSQYPLANLPLPRDARTAVTTVDLSDKITDGNPHQLVVFADCLGSETGKAAKSVSPQVEPYNVSLNFPAQRPIDKGAVAAEAAKDAAAAGAAKDGAAAAATQAAKLAGATPAPAVKAQADAAAASAQKASQAAQDAAAASTAAQAAAASPAASPEDVQAQAAKAAQAQGDAAKALTGATEALAQVQKLTKDHSGPPPPPPPPHRQPLVKTTAEDYLLLDQWDQARAAAAAIPDPAYQHAINAISYAMPFYVNPAETPAENLDKARAELANAQEAASAPKDQALAEVAQGWIDRAPHTVQAAAKAKTDFDAVPAPQKSLLLVKVAIAEGELRPGDRVNALMAYLSDPRSHLTKEDKAGIQKQIDDINLHFLHHRSG